MEDDLSAGGDETPPRKRKRVKYDKRFKSAYLQEFCGIKKLACGNAFAFWELCRCDVNIALGGRDDVRKHCLTQKHLKAASAAKLQPSLSSFLATYQSVMVTRAEL